jgi:hypothetical protein
MKQLILQGLDGKIMPGVEWLPTGHMPAAGLQVLPLIFLLYAAAPAAQTPRAAHLDNTQWNVRAGSQALQ